MAKVSGRFSVLSSRFAGRSRPSSRYYSPRVSSRDANILAPRARARARARLLTSRPWKAVERLLCNDQLHPSILHPTGGGLVAGHRFVLAFAHGGDAIGGDSFPDQIVAHGLSPLLRQHLIPLRTSHVVRIPFDRDLEVLVGLQLFRALAERCFGSGAEPRLAGIEENASRQRHDEPACLTPCRGELP